MRQQVLRIRPLILVLTRFFLQHVSKALQRSPFAILTIVACLGITLGRLAAEGFLAIGFTNAPASIAPVGGRRPVVGTNPFSLAAPNGSGGAEVLIDQSASVIAKSEIMKHAREGLPIPPEWALDPDGRPTSDPEIALKGSMAPAGGYKGVSVALMVEIMAAAMSGAHIGCRCKAHSLEQKVGHLKRANSFL